MDNSDGDEILQLDTKLSQDVEVSIPSAVWGNSITII